MLQRIVFLTVLILPGLCGSLWAEDCGIRGYDGTEIVKFNCQTAADTLSNPSPLQIRTPPTVDHPLGEIRGIVLVDESVCTQSRFRVRLPDGTIKALDVVGITNCEELQAMNQNLNKCYKLENDINCSDTVNWNAGAGFIPVGSGSPWVRPNPFTRTFDGRGFAINDLTINRPSVEAVGLFGFTNGATIRNVGLAGGSIQGGDNAGGLVGHNYNSSITNAYTTGIVTGVSSVGGLVGYNDQSSSISKSYHRTGSVTGAWGVGGLVGGNLNSSNITDSYSTSSVTNSGHWSGGLVGQNQFSASIINSYSTGSVVGVGGVGGLAGTNLSSSSIYNSFAAGTVTATAGTSNPLVASSGAVLVNSFADSESHFYNISHPVYQNSAVAPAPNNAWNFTSVWQSVLCNTPNLRGVGGSQNAAGTGCVTFVCTGAVPGGGHAVMCGGDDAGLTVDTARTLVSACTVAKCEYTCDTGYTRSGSTCVASTGVWVVKGSYISPSPVPDCRDLSGAPWPGRTCSPIGTIVPTCVCAASGPNQFVHATLRCE